MRFNKIKDIHDKTYSFSLENGKLNFNPSDEVGFEFNDEVFVSPGWIDIHTHANPNNLFVGANPDDIGYLTGVNLIIDAGSTGIKNLKQLYQLQTKVKTNLRALLNISRLGIPGQNELMNLKNVQFDYDVEKYHDFVVGYKARISGSVVGKNGVVPLKKFKALKTDDLPIMIHIGNEPPTFKAIVSQLEKDDIITHIFNGKNQNLFKDGMMTDALKEAIAKGIKLDLGHGTSSFDGPLFKKVLNNYPDFKLDFISTDIYRENQESGVVKSLASVMDKVHQLGMKWSDILDCVTINPAKHFKLNGFGKIDESTNNLTFFKFVQGPFYEVDSKGNNIVVDQRIEPVAIILNGEFIKLEPRKETMNIYQELNLKKVVNADGRMTILGVSTISDEVGNAMKLAGQNYFVMKDLEASVDQEIAKMFGFQAAHVVNSASAGIALGISAIIYQDRVHDVNVNIPEKNEVVLLKGQNVNFGAPVEDLLHLVGAKVVEAGYANECKSEDVEYRINKNTAALMYVVSHHAVQKGMLSLDEMIDVAKKHHLPLIVDCASESNLEKYNQKDLDLVIFSGAKAFEGPTSGIVFGNVKLIDNMKKHHKNIGRVMKVGKENILGLYTALKNYQAKSNQLQVDQFFNLITRNPYVDASIVTDALRPEIQRIKIKLNDKAKLNALELSEQLKNGDTAIYLRDYQAKENWLEIDLRSINLADMELINNRVNELLGG